MELDVAPEGRQTAGLDVITRRGRSQIILLYGDYSVASAEWDTGSELFQKLGLSRCASRLPPEVENNVRTIVDGLLKDPSSPQLLLHDSIAMRVSILKIDAAAQSLGGWPAASAAMIALFVEPNRCREELSSAAKRYNLTQRQIEVLGYILQGYCAREISQVMCISETTVNDHFKQLLLRTAARNRAVMVARILNWTDRRDVRKPRKIGSAYKI